MPKILCEYFLTDSDRAPVREFVDSLDAKTQKKFFFVVELLTEFGHKLPPPHAKYLGNSIFELRFSGREGALRIFYFFFHQELAIFTNAFIKKSQKTPPNELNLAIQRRRAYLDRQGRKK